ncbi:hypothetical protein GCM10010439_60460 [Actinocorallia aurantiaca]|uniref:Uncharacterized protein n=1 Tax=Actinocorallia aurantiaca TaxID=46204 RepID=A0ABN3UM37_9ACTN
MSPVRCSSRQASSSASGGRAATAEEHTVPNKQSASRRLGGVTAGTAECLMGDLDMR